jgi:hypothetical protein
VDLIRLAQDRNQLKAAVYAATKILGISRLPEQLRCSQEELS